MNKNNLSERIKIERKRKGLTQAALAEGLNVSEMTVRRWESGERSPRMREVEKISSFFSVPLEDLIGIISPQQKKQDENYSQKINEVQPPSPSEDIINRKEQKIDLGLAYWGSVVDNAQRVANAGTEQEKTAVLMMLNMAANAFQKLPAKTLPQNIGVQQNNFNGDNYNGDIPKAATA